MRFGVSEQRVNARVRRLLEAGLVGANAAAQERATLGVSDPTWLAPGRVGRAPAAAHRYSAAVTTWRSRGLWRTTSRRAASDQETAPADRTGMPTGRAPDARRGGHADIQSQGRRQRRWPDLVQVAGERRRAIELELSIKHTARLQAIIDGYRVSGFDEVLWLVEDPNLRRRLTTMTAHTLLGHAIARRAGRATGTACHLLARARSRTGLV